MEFSKVNLFLALYVLMMFMIFPAFLANFHFLSCFLNHNIIEPNSTLGPPGPTAGTDHPGTNHPGTDHPGTDHPGTDHPGTDHPGTDHPASPKTATPPTSGMYNYSVPAWKWDL